MKYLCAFLLFLSSSFASVEEILEKMTLEEKVGQLFMAPGCPLREEKHLNDLKQLIATFHIGGILAKQSTAVSQIQFLNTLQKDAKIPLLVAADYEWGLAMTMKEEIAFPRNMSLGAGGDFEGIFLMGQQTARMALKIGVQMNLAPVADVNNNPKNPIINTRSFGDNPRLVSECVSTYIRGYQSEGALACAKHFPGHGDTSVDSHKELPLIPHPRERLNSIELKPFRRAIEEGVSSIMVGHLLTPAIDPDYPASLSVKCLQGLLRGEMGFRGLIISDALNMKALTLHYTTEEIALLAHRAGVDLLLYGSHRSEKVDDLIVEQIPKAHRAIVNAYLAGEFEMKKLNESVLRILRMKESFPTEIKEVENVEELQKRLLSSQRLRKDPL